MVVVRERWLSSDFRYPLETRRFEVQSSFCFLPDPSSIAHFFYLFLFLSLMFRRLLRRFSSNSRILSGVFVALFGLSRDPLEAEVRAARIMTTGKQHTATTNAAASDIRGIRCVLLRERRVLDWGLEDQANPGTGPRSLGEWFFYSRNAQNLPLQITLWTKFTCQIPTWKETPYVCVCSIENCLFPWPLQWWCIDVGFLPSNSGSHHLKWTFVLCFGKGSINIACPSLRSSDIFDST